MNLSANRVTGHRLRMTVNVRNAVANASFQAAAGSPALRAAKAEVSLPPGSLALRASVTRGYVCPALRAVICSPAFRLPQVVQPSGCRRWSSLQAAAGRPAIRLPQVVQPSGCRRWSSLIFRASCQDDDTTPWRNSQWVTGYGRLLFLAVSTCHFRDKLYIIAIRWSCGHRGPVGRRSLRRLAGMALPTAFSPQPEMSVFRTAPVRTIQRQGGFR